MAYLSSGKRQYMLQNDFEVFLNEDIYLKTVSLHHHDFYEIYISIDGQVRYTVESRNYELNSGDIMLISPTELHQPILGSHNNSFKRIVIWIAPEFIRSLGSELTNCFDSQTLHQSNLLRLEPSLRSEILSKAMSIVEEVSKREDGYSHIMAQALLTELLVQINRLCSANSYQYNSDDPFDETLMHLVEFINKNLGKQLSLDLLADKFYMSKYHLSREFKRLMGTSLHRYIIQRRLIYSKQLLIQKDCAKNVHTLCGFSDYSVFYRAFKSEYGISPRDFRKNSASLLTMPKKE